ncbi:MAG: RNA-binding protein [Bacteroidetes bacterium GWA2_30_7]|nr:MAG: RNA-binding protein [Bacteroidetes bacterium GWA2_30_7]
MNIYVGSLHYDISEEQLKTLFDEYGEVNSVKIIMDKFSGRSKGFGFVEMTNDEDAKKAIEGLNGVEVEGRTIVVNESIERKDRDSRGPRRNNFRSGGDNRGGGGDRRGGNGGGGNRRDNNYRSNY